VRTSRTLAFASYILANTGLVNDKPGTNGHANGSNGVDLTKAEDDDSDDDKEDEGGNVDAGATGGMIPGLG